MILTCLVKTIFSLQIQSYPLSAQLPAIVGNSFSQPGVNATWDYVAVGGGTGGLVTAARLASNFSVAVVEAGSFYKIENGSGTLIPALGAYQMISPVGRLHPLIN